MAMSPEKKECLNKIKNARQNIEFEQRQMGAAAKQYLRKVVGGFCDLYRCDFTSGNENYHFDIKADGNVRMLLDAIISDGNELAANVNLNGGMYSNALTWIGNYRFIGRSLGDCKPTGGWTDTLYL